MKLADKVKLVDALNSEPYLSAAQFKVACALILHFHNTKTGECYPSLEQLADASHVTRRTVIDALRKMQELGYLSIEQSDGGRRKRNRYHLQTVHSLHRLGSDETVQPVHPNSAASAPEG